MAPAEEAHHKTPSCQVFAYFGLRLGLVLSHQRSAMLDGSEHNGKGRVCDLAWYILDMFFSVLLLMTH